jgi:hypothetical protein
MAKAKKTKKPMALKDEPYKKVEQIEVYVWGQFVGAAALDPRLGYYAFAYDKDFGKSGIELSPLHMPLNDNEQPYIFIMLVAKQGGTEWKDDRITNGP